MQYTAPQVKNAVVGVETENCTLQLTTMQTKWSMNEPLVERHSSFH